MLIIYGAFIFLRFHKKLNVRNPTRLLVASRINVWVRNGWSCNWNQVLNFQHSTSPNSQLASSVISNNAAGYIWSCCVEELVFIPVEIKVRTHTVNFHESEMVHYMKVIKNSWKLPIRNLTITTKCNQEISIHIIHEVYLQEKARIKPVKILKSRQSGYFIFSLK